MGNGDDLISELFEELLADDATEKKIMEEIIKEKNNQEIIEVMLKELK